MSVLTLSFFNNSFHHNLTLLSVYLQLLFSSSDFSIFFTLSYQEIKTDRILHLVHTKTGGMGKLLSPWRGHFR